MQADSPPKTEMMFVLGENFCSVAFALDGAGSLPSFATAGCGGVSGILCVPQMDLFFSREEEGPAEEIRAMSAESTWAGSRFY